MNWLRGEQQAVEAGLERVLPAADAWPTRLHEAMRYAVLGGGKRIRPILARLAYATSGADPTDVAEAVCGLELIHGYSLVHDDLPALDDDVLRRGRATVHVAFDEATAILVGDALLTEGLLVLGRYPIGDDWAPRRAAAVELVGEAVSSRGMIGGQMEDLEAGGQIPGPAASPDDATRLELIHRHKTGALLKASVELGAVLAGVDDDHRRRIARFGECLGLAFQVADDVLDATATATDLGKTPGKDAEAGKLTYVTLYGLDRARGILTELDDEMAGLAEALEGPRGRLHELAHFVVGRGC
jgi:farnesyl diphosphate synthase